MSELNGRKPPDTDDLNAWSAYLDDTVGALDSGWWQNPNLWETGHYLHTQRWDRWRKEFMPRNLYDYLDSDPLTEAGIAPDEFFHECEWDSVEMIALNNVTVQASGGEWERDGDGRCYRTVDVLRGHAEVDYEDSVKRVA